MLVSMMYGYVIEIHVHRTKVMGVTNKGDYGGREGTKWGDGE